MDNVNINWLTAVIGIFGTLGGLYFGNQGYLKNLKADGAKDGTLYSDIGYIKSGIDDLKRKQEKSEERHLEVITRLTSVEASSRQAHQRIDEHVGSHEEGRK